LPKHAQEIYKEAFNSAEDQYGEEGRAHATAWSAVENKYEKNDEGNWVKK
jgi:cation transport regulator